MAPTQGGQSQDAAQAAKLVSSAVQLWLGEVQKWSGWTKDPNHNWDGSELYSEFSTAYAEAMPLIADTVDMALAWLRPWSQAFVDRTAGGN